MLMQTVCIDGSIIEPRYISTDGQDHESGADEEESSADQRPSTQSLLGPVDVTLELCCNVHAPCYLDLEYRPLYSPGAHLSRIMMTSHSNAESAEAKVRDLRTCLRIVISSLSPCMGSEKCAHGDLQLMALSAPAAGRLLDWAGRGTQLPAGFATLRVEASWSLHCWATERVPQPWQQAAGRRCINNPVHLLCRALRMAPASYRRVELTTVRQHGQLTVYSGGDTYAGERRTLHQDRASMAHSAAELGAAMRLYAAEEGLSVHVSPDEQSVVVYRIGQR